MLIEETVLGWKEFELEVMRDRADNFIVVCSIENIDPMGVHTGDSITVAPPKTLTDREYQRLRDEALAVIPEIGVETGGSNVQFAVNPADRRDPRHRDEPARVALVGARLEGDRLPDREDRREARGRLHARRDPQRHHRRHARRFEPIIDYVVIKWPRFAFEKFPGADPTLATQMKSVGEVMSIGRTFCESLAKALRSLELDKPPSLDDVSDEELLDEPADARAGALRGDPRAVRAAAPSDRGRSTSATAIDPWFLRELQALALRSRSAVRGRALVPLGRHLRRRVRRAHAVLLLR